MSELETLFLIIVVLYLIQCVTWVPQDSVAFRASVWRGWRLDDAGFRLGVAKHRGVLGNPLPPFEGVAVCQPPLASFSPLGVVRTGGQPQAYAAFDSLAGITAAGKHVRISGATFVTVHSPVEAARLAAWIEKLRGLEEKKRAAAIERRLAEMLDFDRASERLAEYNARTKFLRLASTALFFLLFVVTPLVVGVAGIVRVWVVLVVLLVLLVAAIGWSFRRAHRQLHPEESEARWTAVMTIALSPMMAIRARDAILRDLFSGSHPLAVARVLCSEEVFRGVAARMLREVTFPIPASEAPEFETSARCEVWFRERLGAAMRRFVSEAKLNPEELLAAPARSSPQCASYCPRCCQQYAMAEGVCKDCGGIELMRFGKEVASGE
jgi:hypothetical protein